MNRKPSYFEAKYEQDYNGEFFWSKHDAELDLYNGNFVSELTKAMWCD